ncbi:MAG TPA: thioredoxin domain-containing protein, partial [Phenylobacterium sp.]
MTLIGETSGAPALDVIKDGTDASFAADVIEASKTVPVIVDFWAPWCGPCKQLGPALEKAVTAARGKVKLVKIDIDKNPAYAGQLRVQSIPAVFAFAGGRPVDGFMGALPESQVKQFVDRLAAASKGGGGDQVDELLALAKESLDVGDLGGAAQAFAEVLRIDPENGKAIGGLARCYLQGGDAERAQEILDLAP